MILSPDAGNALFELVGAFFTWKNAQRLYKDKTIIGVYWPSWFFFTAWGIWNLFYYPAMNQWLSFWAGVILVSGNLVWCYLALKFVLGKNGTSSRKPQVTVSER